MKKIIATAVVTVSMLTAYNVMAQNAQPINAPINAQAINAPATTVAQAKSLGDDTQVVLTGKIDKNLGGEKYNFVDETGSITVDIDNDDWRGLVVTAEDVVVIQGEVDKDFTSIEIDVDNVVKK